MAKIGPFVTDPKAAAYCQIKLDNGAQILVSHDRGGFADGCVTIQEVRLWGLAPVRYCSGSISIKTGVGACWHV
jgi:hypothetical protein